METLNLATGPNLFGMNKLSLLTMIFGLTLLSRIAIGQNIWSPSLNNVYYTIDTLYMPSDSSVIAVISVQNESGTKIYLPNGQNIICFDKYLIFNRGHKYSVGFRHSPSDKVYLNALENHQKTTFTLSYVGSRASLDKIETVSFTADYIIGKKFPKKMVYDKEGVFIMKKEYYLAHMDFMMAPIYNAGAEAVRSMLSH